MAQLFKKVFFALLMAAAAAPLDADPSPFLAQLNQYHLVFKMPDPFTETQVIPNKDLKYDYAVKSDSPKFEIRYLLMPDGHVGIRTFMPVVATDIAGTGGLKSARKLDPGEAGAAFGADEGFSVEIEGMDSEFGRGYKNCVLLAIQKRGSGQAYVFFLFDDSKESEDLLQAAFHSLKFAETPDPTP